MLRLMMLLAFFSTAQITPRVLDLVLKDEIGQPVAEQLVRITLKNNSYDECYTDESGTCRLSIQSADLIVQATLDINHSYRSVTMKESMTLEITLENNQLNPAYDDQNEVETTATATLSPTATAEPTIELTIEPTAAATPAPDLTITPKSNPTLLLIGLLLGSVVLVMGAIFWFWRGKA